MPDAIESLQLRTQCLRAEIEWIKAWQGKDADQALAHLRRLRLEILCCGDLLHHARLTAADPAAQKAEREYRDCLARLQEALPLLQSQLLAQRSRMQAQQNQLQAVTDWVSGSRQTL